MLSGQFRDRLRIGRRGRLCSSVSSPFGGWFGWLGLDRHLQLFGKLVMLANVTCKVQLSIQHMTLSPNPMGSLCPYHLQESIVQPTVSRRNVTVTPPPPPWIARGWGLHGGGKVVHFRPYLSVTPAEAGVGRCQEFFFFSFLFFILPGAIGNCSTLCLDDPALQTHCLRQYPPPLCPGTSNV